MTAEKLTAAVKARAAWGDALPPWVEELARACDLRGVRQISKTMDYSPAVVSQILNNKYQGSLTRVETAVRGRLMNATVQCPVMGGDLWLDRCLMHQSRANDPRFNSMEAALFRRACLGGCPNSHVKPVE